MTVLTYLFAISVTLLAVTHIASTDAKRRRVSGQEPYEGNRRTRLALAVALLPGVALLAVGNGAGFVVWLGATTIAGWGIAALPPKTVQDASVWISGTARRLTIGFSGRAGTSGSLLDRVSAIYRAPQRLSALQERVRVLEEIVAKQAIQEPAEGHENSLARVETLEPRTRASAAG